jgi:UDP-GlcNAc:undecaprenyl-phosphate GlcNAc-1-phosphate transferase
VTELLAQHLFALVVGFGVTTLLIPRIISFAHKRKVLDYPNDRRRVHRVPVPRLGGVAIFVGTMIGGALALGWASMSGTALAYPSILPGVVIGATIIFLTGLVDDLRGVPPRGKLVAQLIAAVIVVLFGFRIDSVTLSMGGPSLALGILAAPLAAFWIVGMTNAFNLIDGADGLAGTFAMIGLAAALGVDLYLHDLRSMGITIAMMGAVFAFLRFNRSPARIFLGDSGSMTLGFFLSIRLVIASTTGDGRTFILVPLFALAFPLVDTSIAIARRWLAGHPLSRADGRHIHHQVLALGIPTRQTVELLALFFSAVALLGLSISFAPPQFTLAFMVATAIMLFAAFFYGTRWLRYGEFAELARSIQSVMRFARTVVREKIRTNEVALQIKTAQTFEEVRALLDGLVDDVRVLDVELVAGDVRPHGPERQQISPHDQLPIRLDYPFVWKSELGTREVILRLWSERPRNGVHPATERVATRIGPALEDWFHRHSRELTPVFGIEAQPMYRKTPAAIRALEG